MSIELTKTQQQTLDAEGVQVCVIDPRTNARYALVPAEEFEAVQELLEDDRRQRAIHRDALRNAAARVEGEP